MFRSIEKSLRRREGDIVQRSQDHLKINQLIDEFVERVFGPAAKQIMIETSLEQGTLIIVTANKIAANELVFQSGPLCRHLQEHQIICNRIIIR